MGKSGGVILVLIILSDLKSIKGCFLLVVLWWEFPDLSRMFGNCSFPRQSQSRISGRAVCALSVIAVLPLIKGRTLQHALAQYHDQELPRIISSDPCRQGDNKLFVEINNVSLSF